VRSIISSDVPITRASSNVPTPAASAFEANVCAEPENVGREPVAGELAGAPAAEDGFRGEPQERGDFTRGEEALVHPRQTAV
jgi:hypothetical protein